MKLSKEKQEWDSAVDMEVMGVVTAAGEAAMVVVGAAEVMVKIFRLRNFFDFFVQDLILRHISPVLHFIPIFMYFKCILVLY